ncbi:hypothetical protein BDZ89DRAFT_1057746 [Hymenopellis radicata]|nr:hypothetical protein BDZ89DRAFT_1057746 [Hymenopellis radicata]
MAEESTKPYGDLEDVQTFVDKYSPSSLEDVVDENGNTILHMISANGHQDVLSYILSLSPPPTSLLKSSNSSGLEIAKALIEAGGAQLIDVKNKAGRSSLGEAENAGWEDGARYFVSVMEFGAEEGQSEETDEKVEGPIEVTIEDANGGLASMTIGGDKQAS